MPYYAVTSGNIFRCVLADDAEAACVAALTHHINDEREDDAIPGKIFETAELGRSSSDNMLIHSKFVIEAGGFTTKTLEDGGG